MVTARAASDSTERGSWRGDEHGGSDRGRLGDQLVEDRPGASVEPGVRLVEQPQLGPAGGQHGQGHPPALAGRELRGAASGAAGR